MFGIRYSNHHHGMIMPGHCDLHPYKPYFSSNWYRRRYRWHHVPYGAFVIPLERHNHFFYNFTQTSYSPIVVYADADQHVLDADGFGTAYEYHHYYFDSRDTYLKQRVAILEYWWVNRSADYDNMVFLLEVANRSLSLRPIDYSELVIEAQEGEAWIPIYQQPVDQSYSGYRTDDRIRFQIEVPGNVLTTGLQYRAFIRAVFQRDEFDQAEIEISNYAYIKVGPAGEIE